MEKKPKKVHRVQAYVTEDTKKALEQLAKEQDRSESYVAGNILNKGVKK
jgi:predicted transcriptional regulator